MDKRIQKSERSMDGTCPGCGCRHMHRDHCPVLKQRTETNDGTDPDKPIVAYAGGLLA